MSEFFAKQINMGWSKDPGPHCRRVRPRHLFDIEEAGKELSGMKGKNKAWRLPNAPDNRSLGQRPKTIPPSPYEMNLDLKNPQRPNSRRADFSEQGSISSSTVLFTEESVNPDQHTSP